MPFNPEKQIAQFWTNRPRGSHKNKVGSVLVIGGSPEFAGASILAASAAFRAGTGRVGLAAPEKVVQACNSYAPEIIGHPLPGLYINPNHLLELQKEVWEYDVILVGNGAGNKAIPALTKLIPYLIRNDVPTVLDATSFDVLKKLNVKLNNCILLPHVGEFKRWAGVDVHELPNSARVELLKNIIGKRKIVINLKDAQSVIVSPHYSYTNKTGDAGMAKAGVGDVLAGLTSGFWSQGMGAFESAACAAWLNGKMGEKISTKKWYAYATRDLLNEISEWKKKRKK